MVLAGCVSDGTVVDNYFDTRDRIADRLNPNQVDCARLYELEVARLKAEFEYLEGTAN